MMPSSMERKSEFFQIIKKDFSNSIFFRHLKNKFFKIGQIVQKMSCKRYKKLQTVIADAEDEVLEILNVLKNSLKW